MRSLGRRCCVFEGQNKHPFDLLLRETKPASFNKMMLVIVNNNRFLQTLNGQVNGACSLSSALGLHTNYLHYGSSSAVLFPFDYLKYSPRQVAIACEKVQK